MKTLSTLLLLGLAVGGWILLAPRELPGGAASYVVPSGSSMRPLLHGNDLVVLREGAPYRPGEVVAYASDELDRIVLHRVVRAEGDRYVTKGDNNTWLDADRPTGGEVVGRMVLRIPGGGKAMEWIRTPRNAAAAGSAAAVLLMGGVGLGVRRRRRRRRHEDARPSPPPRARRPAHRLRVAAAALGVASLSFGAFAVFAHVRPETRTVPTRVPYEHSGSFGYVGLAEPGAVYPDGQVDSGEPVFLKVTDHIGVRFVYRFSSDEPHAVAGTVSLVAELEDGTGWRRVFSLQEPSPFTGDEAVAVGDLDLPRIGSLIREVEKVTEIARPSYTLTLRPSVDVDATVATRQVHETFAPELRFDANPLLLSVADPEDPQKDVADALSHTRGGSVVVQDRLRNPLSIGPLHLASAAARRISLIGLGTSAVLFLLVGMFAVRRQPTESARIQARYGHRIVPVAGGGATLDGPVVDVTTIAALVRVADSYERMILHEDRDGEGWFLVEGDVALYRYRTDGVFTPEDVADEIGGSMLDELDGSFLDEPPEPDTRFLDEPADSPTTREPEDELEREHVAPDQPPDDQPALPYAPVPTAAPSLEPGEGHVSPTPSRAAASVAHGVPSWPALPPEDETRWTPEPEPAWEAPADPAPPPALATPPELDYRWMEEGGERSDGAEPSVEADDQRTSLTGDFFLR